MTLAAGVLAAYLLRCAPDVSPDTMHAIVSVESGGNPLALHDNTTNRAYAPKDRTTALAIADILIARGHSVDIGLAQVNSMNFAGYGVTAATMLEPCANLAIASRILSGAYQRAEASTTDPRTALVEAISAYNTGSLFAGGPYVAAVVAAAVNKPLVPTIGIITGDARMRPSHELAQVRESRLAPRKQRSGDGTSPENAPISSSLRSDGITRSLATGFWSK